MGIERYAERHHGLITRRAAMAGGYSDHDIRGHLRTQRWEAIHPGVYRVVGSQPTWEQALFAAVLKAGPAAVASHTSAARLWGLRLWRADDPIELTVPYASCVEGQHRSQVLFDADQGRRERIPVTTVARTIVDLSSRFSFAELGQAIDEAVHHKTLTHKALRSCVDRLAPAPGRRIRLLQRLLSKRIEGYDRSESALEDRMFRLIAKAGIPLPRQQYTVRIDGRRFRLDGAWPEFYVGVEANGFPHRWASRAPLDAVRGNKLAKAGWKIQVYTSDSDPREFVSDLWDALVARGLSRRAV